MADEAKKKTAEEAVEAEAQKEAAETKVENAEIEATEEKKEATAKAGKRSAKAIAEAEEKQAKEERKAKITEGEAQEKPKQLVKPTRTRLERRGKNFRKAAEKIEKGKTYSLEEALKLATETNPVKFDASVELHINLGVDPKHADQNVRGTVALPAGTGKTVRVAAFTDDKIENADLTGIEAITGQLEKGQLSFDVLVATPQTMPKLGKYAKLLGPRGLMPNPKSGTVTADVAKAVTEAKAGRVEYRVDSTGIVHLGIGKVSFGPAKLEDNARAVLASIKTAKPATLKGTYVKGLHIATTMGPSVVVSTGEV